MGLSDMECDNCKKRFEEGFIKGQESINTENRCCCLIDDDGEVVLPCGGHLNWLEDQLGINKKSCWCKSPGKERC